MTEESELRSNQNTALPPRSVDW